MVSHSALQSIGVSTQSTLRGAKHVHSAPTTTSFTGHHKGIWQWKRNESILPSDSEGTVNRKKSKSDGGAHWHIP